MVVRVLVVRMVMVRVVRMDRVVKSILSGQLVT